jgi:hypothetical protein
MRDKKPLSPLLFYTISCMLFIVDLGSFSIFERPLIYSLLCFYIFQLSQPLSFTRIAFSSLLLSLSPLIYYGRFGISLVYLIPATLLGIKMRHTLYDSLWHYYLLLALCIVAQIVVVERLILGLPISLSYTIYTLIVNIIILWVMSLKSYNSGKRAIAATSRGKSGLQTNKVPGKIQVKPG